eukprot:scaffold1240_cov101-Isochrysis_galbana.AAC.20
MAGGHTGFPTHHHVGGHPRVGARLVPAQELDEDGAVLTEPRDVAVENCRHLDHRRPKRERVDFGPDDGSNRVTPRGVPVWLIHLRIEDGLGLPDAGGRLFDRRLGTKGGQQRRRVIAGHGGSQRRRVGDGRGEGAGSRAAGLQRLAAGATARPESVFGRRWGRQAVRGTQPCQLQGGRRWQWRDQARVCATAATAGLALVQHGGVQRKVAALASGQRGGQAEAERRMEGRLLQLWQDPAEEESIQLRQPLFVPAAIEALLARLDDAGQVGKQRDGAVGRPFEGRPVERLRLDIPPPGNTYRPFGPWGSSVFVPSPVCGLPGAVSVRLSRNLVRQGPPRVAPRGVGAVVRRAVDDGQLLPERVGVALEFKRGARPGRLHQPGPHHERVIVLQRRQGALLQLERRRAAEGLVGVAHDEGRVAEHRVGVDQQVLARAPGELDHVRREVAVGVLVLGVRSQDGKDVLRQVQELGRFRSPHVAHLLVALVKVEHAADVVVGRNRHLDQPLIGPHHRVAVPLRLTRRSQRHIDAVLHPAVALGGTQLVAPAQVEAAAQDTAQDARLRRALHLRLLA